MNAKIADQNPGQIYTFRLLIEYARIIDDNRDRIGYSGDGGEMDLYDKQRLTHEVFYSEAFPPR